jgi:hypothetical protein
LGDSIDDSIEVDAHGELAEQQSWSVVDEHHEKFECSQWYQMLP